MLAQLREVIKQTIPEAVEKISYGMPYYDYYGRLAYFRLAKRHLGLFIMTPVYEQFKQEIAKYDHTDATLRLPLQQKLPIPLIKKMLKLRAKLNRIKAIGV